MKREEMMKNMIKDYEKKEFSNFDEFENFISENNLISENDSESDNIFYLKKKNSKKYSYLIHIKEENENSEEFQESKISDNKDSKNSDKNEEKSYNNQNKRKLDRDIKIDSRKISEYRIKLIYHRDSKNEKEYRIYISFKNNSDKLIRYRIRNEKLDSISRNEEKSIEYFNNIQIEDIQNEIKKRELK